MKYSFLFLILISLSFSACNKAPQKEQAGLPAQPNILFIAVDDLRPELNFYGASHIKSPNLDKLAAQSLVFNRAYCNIPVCGASRASLLSGARPARHRFINYHTWKDKDFPDAVSLPKHFKDNGYTTISNGKIYHHDADDSSAWNEVWRPTSPHKSWRNYLDEENIAMEINSDQRGMPYEKIDVDDSEYFDGMIADKGISDLKNLKAEGKPFFLALGFLKPHLPFNAPAKYWDMYARDDMHLPDSYMQPETTPSKAFHNFGELRAYNDIPKKGPVSEDMAKALIHGYYACVSYVDAQIGRVVDELEKQGLADNTIIILWGDHGWNLGDHMLWCKHCNFETAMRTPMLIKVPGKTKGVYTDAITEYIDIYPSLCELAGLELPSHLDGESFVSIIEGNNQRKKDFAISKFHDGITYIKGTMNYTEWTDDEGVAYAKMLFDHATDPLELDNLAEKEEYAQTVEQMATELRQNWGEDFLK